MLRLQRQKPVLLLPDAKLGKVVKQPEDFDEPYDENNHDNAVKDSLNLTLHGDKAID